MTGVGLCANAILSSSDSFTIGKERESGLATWVVPIRPCVSSTLVLAHWKTENSEIPKILFFWGSCYFLFQIRETDRLDCAYLSQLGFHFSLRERERAVVRMLEGKAIIEDTDMPVKMQFQAMASASQALDLYDVLDCKSIAAHIKKEFDMKYGGGWQCVVGSNFGCFFTHSKGTFIYFTLETLNFLIFKGASSASAA